MGLDRLTITPEIGSKIEARFNPERYTVTKSVQIAEITIPGLDSPAQQYVRGQSEKITFDLYFDTTEFGYSVAAGLFRRGVLLLFQLRVQLVACLPQGFCLFLGPMEHRRFLLVGATGFLRGGIGGGNLLLQFAAGFLESPLLI